MKLRSLYMLIAAVILTGATSCKDEEEFGPCSCDTSDVAFAFYKGCDFISDCRDAYDCAIKEMLSQIYRTLEYPTEALDSSIEGLVVVEFDVDVFGNPDNFRVLSDTLGYGLPEAAIKAAKSLSEPGFYPAIKNCKVVVSEFRLPIKFKL